MRLIAIIIGVIALVLIVTSLIHLFVIGFWIALAVLVVFGAFRLGRRVQGGRSRQ